MWKRIAFVIAVASGAFVAHVLMDYLKVVGYVRPYYGIPHIELSPGCPPQESPSSRARGKMFSEL